MSAQAVEGQPEAPRRSGDPLVKITGLTKYFPITQGIVFQKKVGDVHAVDGVDLEVYPGETVVWSERPGAASRPWLA